MSQNISSTKQDPKKYVITEDLLYRLWNLGKGFAPVATGQLVYDMRGTPLSDEIKKAREDVLNRIEESLTTCAFYDEMISSEGECLGKRNGESGCEGCSYFEIDGNQIRATIESLRGDQHDNIWCNNKSIRRSGKQLCRK
jgi:hypothetical protein